MIKHTQGPWNTAKHYEGLVTIVAANGDHVAQACEYGQQSETPDAQAANARLISAAPEMLAMVRKMYAIEMNPAISAELAHLIEKAEGKQS